MELGPGKVAVVTGGASGIGLALANAFAAAGSKEQALGIEQINTTMTDMESVTQATAASAEESAAASEEMKAQARRLKEIVASLNAVLTGAAVQGNGKADWSAAKEQKQHLLPE